jgi:hypothetical protein
MHSEPAWAGGPVLVRSGPTTGKRGAAAMGRAMRGLVVRARRGLLLRGKGGFSLCLATRGRPASSQERAWRRSRWARSCRRGSPAVPLGGFFLPRKVPAVGFLPHQPETVGAQHPRWACLLPGAIFSSMPLYLCNHGVAEFERSLYKHMYMFLMLFAAFPTSRRLSPRR